MPTLDWIGKKAVLNHHREIPIPLLNTDDSLSIGDPGAGNLLVRGDNLFALKALLPYYAAQVKCIYIDPPYNTGKEGWAFNDAVTSPEMRAWLGKVVGPEAEDLTRHDKWLCMMYPRLQLLRDLLRDDGVLFISIGKDELGHLRVLADEVFGSSNLLDVFIWQVEGNVENQEAITSTHEYVLAYERRPGASRINTTVDPNVDDGSKLLRDFAENSVVKNGPANPASIITLPVGFPCAVDRLSLPCHPYALDLVESVQADQGYIKREMRSRYSAEYPVRLDDLLVESGVLVEECRVYSGWASARKLRRFIEAGCEPLLEEDGSRLRFFISATGVPTYLRENRKGHFVPTILRNMGTTERTSNELERMGVRFSYPKPVGLVEYLLSLYVRSGDVVLDSFCGSGTTGHAVLKLNSERRLGLRCILVELDEHVVTTVTLPRLKAACEGYNARRGVRVVAVPGLGGGFRVCSLGAPLFNERGALRETVSFAELARHVYLKATGCALPAAGAPKSSLLGVHNNTAVYLLFNGEPSDGVTHGSVLTASALAALPMHDGPKIVFGEGCRLGEERLAKERITFRQIPYRLERL